MTWKKTTFERQKLFDEVRTTPVTKLAEGYGLSDVGRRKICVTLDVPLPPRGYWAKLAAGKTIPKPPLRETTAATTYVRAMYVAQVDEVLEERITEARDSTTDAVQVDAEDYSPPLDTKDFSPQAKLVVRAMKGTKLDEGAFSSFGVTWADITVSADLKQRALLLVDRLAHELEVLGAKVLLGDEAFGQRRGDRRDLCGRRRCGSGNVGDRHCRLDLHVIRCFLRHSAKGRQTQNQTNCVAFHTVFVFVSELRRNVASVKCFGTNRNLLMPLSNSCLSAVAKQVAELDVCRDVFVMSTGPGCCDCWRIGQPTSAWLTRGTRRGTIAHFAPSPRPLA